MLIHDGFLWKFSVAMTSESRIPKTYNGPEVEKKWSGYWLENRFFKADPASKGQPYSIVMPPPNVTGALHMGHALNMTIQDILVRWNRMKGYNVLWVPGTDHAGIATQNVVERHIATEGLRRQDLGRDKFEKIVWKWKEEYEARILRQIRRLGCSCDWSRTRFTMDEGLSSAVREVFVQLYEAGLIYRGEYLVNWCLRCSTAISDLEVIHRSVPGKLWHICYPLVEGKDFIEVATTRPETMLGDTAVAVHPEDVRYKNLVGKFVVLPLVNRQIPVVADSFVDREFGTGAVKVTPGHDPNDFEVGRRHQLPILQVIGEDGRMTSKAGSYEGLDRFEARQQVVKDLLRMDSIKGIEDCEHQVGHCQRCETIVEPLVSKQWFVKIQPLVKPAIEVVEKNQTVFFPKRYKKIYLNWMYGIHDWCVSRQLWWGHRIPAWYCLKCDQVRVERKPPISCNNCGPSEFRQDEDVLDTWFSSGLWPFSTLGWPQKTFEQKIYYPTKTLVTGADIIFFWIARMMMLGLRFKRAVPFEEVHITGLVKDADGRKMSKTEGNVIDPLEIIEKYGADAVRFTLSISAAPGTDIPFSVSRMAGYRSFCNKIWNAGRFFLLNMKNAKPYRDDEIGPLLDKKYLKLEDRWILGRLQEVTKSVEDNLGKYRFHEASNTLYHFFWDELCDWYIEFIKVSMTEENLEDRKKIFSMPLCVLDASLRLLHPFMPFITEELWQKLPHEGSTIALATFPEAREDWIDREALTAMGMLQDLISEIRRIRTENRIDPRHELPCQLRTNAEHRKLLEQHQQKLVSLARLQKIIIVDELRISGFQVRGLSSLGEFLLQLDEVIDIKKERNRLMRQIEKIKTEVNGLEHRLSNPTFIKKAPAEVVRVTKERFQKAQLKLTKLKEQLNGFSQS